jgi:hypothetical protein
MLWSSPLVCAHLFGSAGHVTERSQPYDASPEEEAQGWRLAPAIFTELTGRHYKTVPFV